MDELDLSIVKDFALEATEQLDHIDQLLLKFEQHHSSSDVAEALGCFHSLKGTAGFASLFDIQDICHAAEALLAAARNGSPRGADALDLAFESVTVARTRLDEILDSCRTGAAAAPSPQVARFLKSAAPWRKL